ncbi:hypothetical protein [Dysgonomonas massiliensis]|uniref:hypothetical protein n=1 Tax=Dysgonomonas massiliensis TaxID=2040292 RepID=UPI0011AF938C|nr:hypothetical protein [Dysgonomonas massiliensis]
MKKILLFFILLCIILPFINAQEKNINQVFQSAVENCEAKKYNKSACEFMEVIEMAGGIEKLSDYVLFQGTIIFAGNNDQDTFFKIFNYLIDQRYFSDLKKTSEQIEFEKWKDTIEWASIISKIEENNRSLPRRTKQNVQAKLLEAKFILENDNGNLWGYPIWNDSLIVIDYDNTIYSLTKLSNSKTDNDTLYYKKIEPDVLSFVNTTQPYDENEYATVLINYMNDKSSTIIHELFHLLQFKFRKYEGNPINYLDETNARILLRLEYQALKKTLKAIDQNEEIDEVKSYLKDAVIFRNERQKQYTEYLGGELDLETLEGLANYTGIVLSSYENKYEKAIAEINQREKAETYTRPFPYATGPGYGMIFDYLNVPWRHGLDKIYNFADIYETYIHKSKLEVPEIEFEQAKQRNNFEEIHKQEMKREEIQKDLVKYYTDLLIDRPVLRVAFTNDSYNRTFNMNGTLTLNDKGIVYSDIVGTDKSGGRNFGNFSTIKGKDKLGESGVLSYEKDNISYFIFPLPIEITETKIVGEFYIIDLNENWEVITKDDGNMEVVKK